MGRQGGEGGSDRLVGWESRGNVAGRAQAHLEAGADHVCIQLLPADPTSIPQCEQRAPAKALLG